MGKYYVHSGTMRKVVQAESARRAALWAVHETMQQVLPIDEPDGEVAAEKSQKVARDGVVVLADRVTVSEQGFHRQDGDSLKTMEVVSEWNDLMSTLDRLERMLHRAY